jgi:hypothetical protein
MERVRVRQGEGDIPLPLNSLPPGEGEIMRGFPECHNLHNLSRIGLSPEIALPLLKTQMTRWSARDGKEKARGA